MFHRRFGDQKVFTQNGLTCAVFTSGITMLTNKTSDTAGTLDYEILRKRIFLIFHWLEKYSDNERILVYDEALCRAFQ